jgi:hypothetical protein
MTAAAPSAATEPAAPTQSRQPHLSHQDASTVDPTKLTALTPEVVRAQFCLLLLIGFRCFASQMLPLM